MQRGLMVGQSCVPFVEYLYDQSRLLPLVPRNTAPLAADSQNVSVVARCFGLEDSKWNVDTRVTADCCLAHSKGVLRAFSPCYTCLEIG
jgi:hypothetical protein